MTVTASSFVANFPEFSNPTIYPSASINLWLAYAQARIDYDLWGSLGDFGVQLLLAHNLALQTAAVNAASNGAVPGQASGPLASKAAGGLSASYDTGAASEKDAGQFNATTYGQRFWELAQTFGAGGLFL